MTNLAKLILSIASCVSLISPAVYAADSPPELPLTAHSVYWSDADSGKIAGFKFRLANVDAPETGSMKQRGGAKCEAERKLGYEAKAFMVSVTDGKTLVVDRHYGFDKYGRLVVDLSTDGHNISALGVQAGHLAAWPHKKGRAQTKKPDWCHD